MIIKLTAQNVPSYVELRDIAPGVQGYIITFPDGSSDQIALGDYIIDDGPNSVRMVRVAEYSVNQTIQNEIMEQVGRASVRTLTDALFALVQQSEQVAVFETVGAILGLLGAGIIVKARTLANLKPTSTAYTAARKTFLLSEIDKAVAIITP